MYLETRNVNKITIIYVDIEVNRFDEHCRAHTPVACCILGSDFILIPEGILVPLDLFALSVR